MLQNIYLPPQSTLTLFRRRNRYYGHRTPSNWDPVLAFHEEYIVADKPAGLPTVPTRDNATQNFLSYLRRNVSKPYSSAPILLTTRLDVGTHGLLVFARTPEFQNNYNKMMGTRQVKKIYQAVVIGWTNEHQRRWNKIPNMTNQSLHRNLCVESTTSSAFASSIHLTDYLMDPSSSGHTEKPKKVEQFPEAEVHHIGSDSEITDRLRVETSPVRTSKHIYECHLKILSATDVQSDSLPLRPFSKDFVQKLLRQSSIKLLTIELLTGKTHQIRAQLKYQGLSIVGDWLYGCTSEFVLPTGDCMALCCSFLSFDDYHRQKPKVVVDEVENSKRRTYSLLLEPQFNKNILHQQRDEE
eukprot:TRINITY_DN6971_c0_g1_i1.p2 TRINITY_DN6971_c0_g1~~TRINITY_DN6971_c0_g1_i1.p2  ORF type:complete len:412 (+),score=55.53 TRINITY_DN6971_c0_g1_i1:176-1237(+)